jgi:hypothetical protein
VLNYSHRQIASVLGITPCASEVRFCRAMKQLRFAIQGEAPSTRKLSAANGITREATSTKAVLAP